MTMTQCAALSTVVPCVYVCVRELGIASATTTRDHILNQSTLCIATPRVTPSDVVALVSTADTNACSLLLLGNCYLLLEEWVVVAVVRRALAADEVDRALRTAAVRSPYGRPFHRLVPVASVLAQRRHPARSSCAQHTLPFRLGTHPGIVRSRSMSTISCCPSSIIRCARCTAFSASRAVSYSMKA